MVHLDYRTADVTGKQKKRRNWRKELYELAVIGPFFSILIFVGLYWMGACDPR